MAVSASEINGNQLSASPPLPAQQDLNDDDPIAFLEGIDASIACEAGPRRTLALKTGDRKDSIAWASSFVLDHTAYLFEATSR